MPEEQEYTLVKNALTEPKSVNEIVEETGLKMGIVMTIIHCTNKIDFYIRQGKVHLKKQREKGKNK